MDKIFRNWSQYNETDKKNEIDSFYKKCEREIYSFLAAKLINEICINVKDNQTLVFPSSEILKILKSEPWIFLRIDHSDIDQISQIFV